MITCSHQGKEKEKENLTKNTFQEACPPQSAHTHPKLPSFIPDKFRVNHIATHTYN